MNDLCLVHKLPLLKQIALFVPDSCHKYLFYMGKIFTWAELPPGI